MPKKDPRTVTRILEAASLTHTRNARESAIVGGIVRSVIDTGHFKPTFVEHYTAEAMRHYARDIRDYEHDCPFGSPTPGEVRQMVQRFMAHYPEPPTEAKAA